VAESLSREEKSEFQLTRELELLISGALVFALLQLPGLLDDWWLGRQVHLTGVAHAVPFGAYYVGKLASYGLIVTILLHFLLRSFWVALMGLRSAWPEGIDESRMDSGPFVREFYRGRLLTVTQLEERIDRIAAILFAFVFLFLTLLTVMAFWAAVAGLVAVLITRLSGREESLKAIFWTIFSLFISVQIVVAMIDKWSKKRPLSPRASAIATRLLKFMHYSTLNFVYAPIFLTFSTRVSRKVMSVIQVGFIYAMLFIFAVSVLSSLGVIGFDSYAWFPPNAGARNVRSSHYENLNAERFPSLVPTVQSDIISEPYIRLFVPYNVHRDNALIRHYCRDLEPFRGEGLFVRPRKRTDQARTVAALQCFDRIYSVTLDGAPVSLGGASFHVHPRSGIHGRLMMIPATALASGRHELVIRRKSVPGEETSRTPGEFFIPFWR
jgi:hypothetical protein